jgi:hypothetical protein
MSLLLQDLVGDARARLKKGKSDDNGRWRLALAYYHAGQLDEVLDVARQVDHRSARAGYLNEMQAWILNTEAYALDALGQRSGGDANFDLLANLPLRAGASWVTNFRINRVLRLVGYGEWQRGLDAAAATDELAPAGMVSRFGRMLITSAKVCALANLDRMTEASTLLPVLDANRAVHPQAAVRAHLCAGQVERAAAIVIESLEHPERRDAMAAVLQGPQFEFWYPPSPALPDIRQSLRYRPDVAKAFERVARDIPAVFAPRPGTSPPGQGST